jgi:hypothetical protein
VIASFVSTWLLDGPGGVEGDVFATLVWVVLAALVTSVLYPPLRRRIEAFVKRHFKTEMAEIHSKLDHIIDHHPDIPPYEKDDS